MKGRSVPSLHGSRAHKKEHKKKKKKKKLNVILKASNVTADHHHHHHGHNHDLQVKQELLKLTDSVRNKYKQLAQTSDAVSRYFEERAKPIKMALQQTLGTVATIATSTPEKGKVDGRQQQPRRFIKSEATDPLQRGKSQEGHGDYETEERQGGKISGLIS